MEHCRKGKIDLDKRRKISTCTLWQPIHVLFTQRILHNLFNTVKLVQSGITRDRNIFSELRHIHALCKMIHNGYEKSEEITFIAL